MWDMSFVGSKLVNIHLAMPSLGGLNFYLLIKKKKSICFPFYPYFTPLVKSVIIIKEFEN